MHQIQSRFQQISIYSKSPETNLANLYFIKVKCHYGGLVNFKSSQIEIYMKSRYEEHIKSDKVFSLYFKLASRADKWKYWNEFLKKYDLL